MEQKESPTLQNTFKRKCRKVFGDLQLESNALRQAVFNQWFITKQKERNKLLEVTSRKREALRLKEQKEREEKMTRSKSSFQAWLKMKKKEISLSATAEDDQPKDDKNTSLQKSEAGKAFRSWKSQKDKLLKEKREKEERQKKFERDRLEEKKNDGQIAFQLWKEQKDHERWKTIEHLVDIDTRTTEQNKMIEERRLRLALRAFNTWLAEKVFQSFYFDDEPSDVKDDRPPWYPPGPL